PRATGRVCWPASSELCPRPTPRPCAAPSTSTDVLPAGALAGVAALTSVLLAGPVSALLARSRWPDRAPRSALLLFQAVCLAAGLCLIGAGLVLALQDQAHSVLDGMLAVVDH